MHKPSATFLALAVCACSTQEPSADQRSDLVNDDWLPIAPHAAYAGKSLEEWAIEWRRWAYAQTDCEQDTVYDVDGSLCALHQSEDGPLFFFDRGPLGSVRTQCRVPSGRAIGVPIGMFSNDNAGVEKPLSEDELLESVVTVQRTVRDLKLEVDGRKIEDLEERAVGPVKSTYYIPPAPNWYSCRKMSGVEDETVDPVYLGGYLAILPPPTPGQHTIHYAYTLTYNDVHIVSDVTSTFHVD